MAVLAKRRRLQIRKNDDQRKQDENARHHSARYRPLCAAECASVGVIYGTAGQQQHACLERELVQLWGSNLSVDGWFTSTSLAMSLNTLRRPSLPSAREMHRLEVIGFGAPHCAQRMAVLC